LPLKLVFLRARPVTGEGPLSFFNLEGWGRKANLFYSLPSGDVAVVAGAAAYLFYRVKNTALRALLMLLPVLTAFSRVYKSKHWPSDTAFAVGLALLAALFVVHYERFASPKKV
ncbi:MAG: phosphatase PAP2 family protein, partial [Candidatus Omnitrophota bacterium]